MTSPTGTHVSRDGQLVASRPTKPIHLTKLPVFAVVHVLIRQCLTRLGGSTQNAPSGIAQLRKSSEQNVSISEPMNLDLDDLIVADNIAPPAGLAASPSPEVSKHGEDRPLRSRINAIPIKHRQASLPHFVPQSVPVPTHAPNAQHEFGYITRHHRKTSIDERRVSHIPTAPPYPGIHDHFWSIGRHIRQTPGQIVNS